MSTVLPNPIDLGTIEDCVETEDCGTLDESMSYKQPVKGIAMMGRKGRLGGSALDADGENGQLQIRHGLFYPILEWTRQGQLAEPALDRQLPDRTRTEQPLI